MSRKAAIILSAVLVLLIIAGGVGLYIALSGARKAHLHLIPEGFVGWAEARYGVEGAPPLPLEDGHLVFRYGPDGKLQTSTEFQEGWAVDQYYYVDGEQRTPLSQLTPGFDGRIWHAYDSFNTVIRSNDQVVRLGARTGFFVGTEEQYNNADSASHSAIPLPTP
jgi:hypothetical protein